VCVCVCICHCLEGPAHFLHTATKLLPHCCYTAGTLLPHCFYTAATLLLHCFYTAGTLLLHCCYTAVTLLPHCFYTAATLLPRCLYTATKLLPHCFYTAGTLLLHCCFTAVTQLLQCCYTAVTLFHSYHTAATLLLPATPHALLLLHSWKPLTITATAYRGNAYSDGGQHCTGTSLRAHRRRGSGFAIKECSRAHEHRADHTWQPSLLLTSTPNTNTNTLGLLLRDAREVCPATWEATCRCQTEYAHNFYNDFIIVEPTYLIFLQCC
jgi:hypothetical protein